MGEKEPNLELRNKIRENVKRASLIAGGLLLAPTVLNAMSVGQPSAMSTQNITSTDWSSIKGKPSVTVSAIGISTGGSAIANNGADFGPDTAGTATSGIQEALNSVSSTGGTIYLLDGIFKVNGNAIVVQNKSNFRIWGGGGAIVQMAPNTHSLPNNILGDIIVIADCTDFEVNGIIIDGNRDNIAPITVLTANASSGQASVTIASGAGANYQAGAYD